MGDGPAMLTGGDGGWNSEVRRGLAPVTWWGSPDAYRQSIPLMFDGDSQEQAINLLYRLARSPGERVPPPALTIAGQAVHRADLTWVVEGLDAGVNVIRRASDGNRVRQDFTVRLLDYTAVETVVERSPSKRAAGKGKQGTSGSRGGGTYIVKAGDTLPKIAARKDIYNDASKWKLIANANNIRDPRALKVGRKLTIPKA
jgi:nucleoid-associated protein YgaU